MGHWNEIAANDQPRPHSKNRGWHHGSPHIEFGSAFVAASISSRSCPCPLSRQAPRRRKTGCHPWRPPLPPPQSPCRTPGFRGMVASCWVYDAGGLACLHDSHAVQHAAIKQACRDAHMHAACIHPCIHAPMHGRMHRAHGCGCHPGCCSHVITALGTPATKLHTRPQHLCKVPGSQHAGPAHHKLVPLPLTAHPVVDHVPHACPARRQHLRHLFHGEAF
jgi:hypothetical protein